jgi:hypothetical protein
VIATNRPHKLRTQRADSAVLIASARAAMIVIAGGVPWGLISLRAPSHRSPVSPSCADRRGPGSPMSSNGGGLRGPPKKEADSGPHHELDLLVQLHK